MCGIAGIVTNQPIDEDRLRRAARLMRHRGPDSAGMACPPGARLAFQRLAIIDVSPDGDQPMSNESGDVWVIFNGEVYGFQELRAELQSRHRFVSRTDTEVLLHGYEEWGLDGLLRRIDGMFAFALWDARLQQLFLARDRFGKKPLYYAELPEGVAFASTLNSLVELLPDRPSVDYDALDQFLVYQAVPAPRTIYRGVSMLPPAHCARWKAGGRLQVDRYWSLSYANKRRCREPELLDELDSLVRKAVQRRLVADVPLGAFLSGGVDSSLVVGVMSDLGVGPVEAINVGFEDPEYNEADFARKVARHWKANLHEHVMRPDEVQNLPEIVWHYGQPMADVSIVPTYAVARAAREHVTVVLNGDGGDELFGGYARPVIARASEQFRTHMPVRLRKAAAKAAGALGRRGRMLASSAMRTPQQAFTYDRGLRTRRGEVYASGLLCHLESSHPDSLYASVWDRADGPSDADRALFGDLTTYLPDQLLVKMDVSTMAHSVEARSPLLDRGLAEFAASVPTEQLIRYYRPKYLLKRLAERYAPREIIYRRKRGFVMPASKWLRQDLRRHAGALLCRRSVESRGLFRADAVTQMLDEHLSGEADWGHILWTLMVLEVWFRLFVDRSLGRHDRLDAVL